jgi:hypothetical protein
METLGPVLGMVPWWPWVVLVALGVLMRPGR